MHISHLAQSGDPSQVPPRPLEHIGRGNTRSAKSCELEHVPDEHGVLHNVGHGGEGHKARGQDDRAERSGSTPGELARGSGLQFIECHSRSHEDICRPSGLKRRWCPVDRQGVGRRRTLAGLGAAGAGAASGGWHGR